MVIKEIIMSLKLEYLRKFDKRIEIVKDENIESQLCKIPEKWWEVLMEKDFAIKKNKVIKIWNDVSGIELRNTIQYLSENLVSLDLLYDGTIYSLLYGIEAGDGDIAYYEGKFGLDLNKNSELKSRWKDMPKSIQRFYEDLHNGFYYYASHSMGLVPEDEITYLAEYDWGILDELKESVEVDMASSFGFFSNGMGAYVVIDSNNCLDEEATLWFKDRKPKYGVNFWDIVDEWIVLGIQF